MNEYVFRLYIDNELSGEGCGQGNSTIEAFENAVEIGTVILPNGQTVEVVALNNKGLSLTFTAMKSF